MLTSEDDVDELADDGFRIVDNQTVCLHCIHDDGLREAVGTKLAEWQCSFCGTTADEATDQPIAANFEDFMIIVMEALRFVYGKVEDNLYWDSEDRQWMGGSTVSSTEAAYEHCSGDVTDPVMEALAAAITYDEWTTENFLELRPDEALRFTWESFLDKVKYRSRFVFLSAGEEPSDRPDEYTTEQFLQKIDTVLRDHGCLASVPAGRTFWRGRLAGDLTEAGTWNSAAHLGPPPRDRAANSRMSPAGITMFYGSNDIETAIAEISAHSKEPYAVVGRFETVRDLTLLDLTTLPALPSLYTPAGRTRERYDLVFLRRFARDLAKPIALDGREHIEYVPTQVITEYLRYISPLGVNGILFRSAQNGGVCCVLFCDASACLDPGQQPEPFVEPLLVLHTDSVTTLDVPLAHESAG
ncbi:RES domain-containing protein [Amycolatopsis roodepoortensis]|uniref:HEPN-associated N-terminal domain-containing protein n=1 Tax=Amycolatopsis roodepoortensis TaxID=700274 RepID=UPI00214BCA99|nr:HEPN-associated N-terminal domain-containing protein [Amycolatopsis roodepoortensis]UUV32356.1 RES domain-containing protein [Amycolatopsis roodepoortensis]